MKLAFCIDSLLVFLSCAPVATPSVQIQKPANMDVATTSAGPFRLEYRMPVDEHRRVMTKMQVFAWTHWKGQLNGRLEYVFVTAEGGRVEQTMFFERDERGAYRVRIERKEVAGRSSHRFILRSTKLAYSVQRLDEKRPNEDGYSALPDSEEARPGTYILDFKDKDNQLIVRWEPDRTL